MTNFKRSIGAFATAALLVSSTAYAVPATAPLPAGKPAGAKEAALLSLAPAFWIAIVAVAVGIGFAVSNNGNSTTITTTGTGG